MGWGDEVMASGEARAAHARDGRRVQILDRFGRVRAHRAWIGNPKIAGPDETGDFHRLVNGGRRRPYQHEVTPERFRFNLAYRPTPGELYFTDGECAFAARFAAPDVVVAPEIKPGASPNKDWGWARWCAFAEGAQRRGIGLVQMGARRTRVLPGASWIETADIRQACAVLARAQAYVGHEGGLHHSAAALGVPGVVIFGGFIPVELTGYPLHRNLGVSLGEACGRRTPCRHCAQAMAAIAPDQVLAELESVLDETERRHLAA